MHRLCSRHDGHGWGDRVCVLRLCGRHVRNRGGLHELCARVVLDCRVGKRMHRMFDWDVLRRDGREQSDRLYELPCWHVFERWRCELCDGVHELHSRQVLGHGRRDLFDDVHELHSRDVLGYGRGDLFDGVHELRGREVFDRCCCELFDGVHQLPGRDVFERCRGELVDGMLDLPSRSDNECRRKCLREHSMSGRHVLIGECVHELHGRGVFEHGRCDRFDGVHQLRGRDVLDRDGRQQCGRLCQLPGWLVRVDSRGKRLRELSDQHVFGGGGVLVPGVSGERAVCGRQRVSGILLLQERVCACGGGVHLPDL